MKFAKKIFLSVFIISAVLYLSLFIAPKKSNAAGTTATTSPPTVSASPSPAVSPSTSPTASPTGTATSPGGSGGGGAPETVKIQKPASLSNTFSSVGSIVNFIFDTLVGISGTIFIVMLLVGGIQYLTSAGSEEGSTKAKKLLFNAVVGICIVAFSWAIGTFILKTINMS